MRKKLVGSAAPTQSNNIMLLVGLVVFISCAAVKDVHLESADFISHRCSDQPDSQVFRFNKRAKPLPIEEMIRRCGYPVENHDIRTEDGYRLTYHRIPFGRRRQPVSGGGSGGRGGFPVLLQHGLLGSSAVWAIGPNPLGFLLADAGFDVWLGNTRGNKYSRKHDKFDPDTDKEEFWDFSWHEMGKYDLPAAIDHILNVTGAPQLIYVGHSMGTTTYFVLGSTKPNYMKKIKAMVAMAPVAYLSHVRNPLLKLVLRANMDIFRGLYEILPHSGAMYWFGRTVCLSPRYKFVCREFMFLLNGDRGYVQVSLKTLQTAFEFVPAGTSLRTNLHYVQIIKRGAFWIFARPEFGEFDYGAMANVRKYGGSKPPAYALKRVTSPVYVYYASNDWFAVKQDVNHAIKQLPNVQKITRIPDDKFNHFDFMWAVDAKTLLFDDLISTLKNITRHDENNKY